MDSESTASPEATPAPATTALSTWTAPATPALASEMCSIDAVNGEGAVDGAFRAGVAQGMTFQGWVTTPDRTTAPSDIALVLDGPTDFQITGTTGELRQDVSDAYGAGAANAGFKIELPELQVPPGEYALLLVDAAGTFACNTKVKLFVD